MDKKLNKDKINQKMKERGLSQTSLAERLDVSKEAVSQWLNHKSFPRPSKLLQLGKLLSLGFDELVCKDVSTEPVVAFRKMKGTKTKDHHVEKAQGMGRFLKNLVPYLPFDLLEMPPVLKNPVNNYAYLQKVAQKVRQDVNVEPDATIDFQHLIRRFNELQTVLIPVLWGDKKRHENALHIFLPDSKTTWVYLNLDVNIHDFKFWMAHELGHSLTPEFKGEEAEDFADAFAGALLFPENKAESAYHEISLLTKSSAQINKLLELAKNEIISPYTIYYQLNAYAEHSGKPILELNQINGAITNFNKHYPKVSKLLFHADEEIKAVDFIHCIEENFDTSIFNVLRQYIKNHQKGAGIVQAILDMPLLDARSIYAELT